MARKGPGMAVKFHRVFGDWSGSSAKRGRLVNNNSIRVCKRINKGLFVSYPAICDVFLSF